MKYTNSIIKRIVACILGLALVLPSSLSFLGVGSTAEAATSLPNIQAIRSSGGVFEIMELVPEQGQGSIGYYVDGQEPCANWKTEAAKMSVTERSTYLNPLFNSLETSSILGTGDKTPLEGTKVDGSNYYKEYYPWTKPDTVENRITLITATNDTRIEEQTIKGIATDGGVNSGAYLSSGYLLQSAKTGRYNQKIASFAQDQIDGSFYYNVKFEALTLGQAVPNGTYLYYEAQEEQLPSLKNALIVGGGTKNLVFQEIKGEYTVQDATKTYFAAEFDKPNDEFHATTAPYRAISDEFTDVGNDNGWFKADVTRLQYLGDSEGNISFVANNSGPETKISYDCVFYEGGYTNNNWFIKHVFDWEEGETKPSVIVKTYIPAELDQYANNLGLVGMLVISNGFNPSGAVSNYTSDKDISSATLKLICDAVHDDPEDPNDDCNLPIIFDSRLASATPSLAELYGQLKTLTGLESAPSVVRSVYFFDATHFANNSSTQQLITPAFNRYLPESTYKTSNSRYNCVYEEILDENFTRQNTGSGIKPLEEKVTIARVIRYIVNFAKQRNVTPKGIIRVLEVQPAKGSYFETDAGKIALQSWTGFALENIKIDTMTSSEFIGKIDELTETYDLVYFGDDLTSFTTSGGKTDFNDNGMDGLIYSNIGDTVVSGGDSGWNMSGLLDRDYDTKQTFRNEDTGNDERYNAIDTGDPSEPVVGVSWRFNEKDTARTFRYSGNDITPAKLNELSDFVSSGYPLIVADQLMEAGRGIQYYNVELSSIVDYSNNKVTLTPVVSGSLQNHTVKSCKWYKDGIPIEGIPSDPILAPKIVIADTSEHKYYCIVTTVEGGSTATSSTSNTIVVKAGTSAKIIDNEAKERNGLYIKDKYDFKVVFNVGDPRPYGLGNASTEGVSATAKLEYIGTNGGKTTDSEAVLVGKNGVTALSMQWNQRWYLSSNTPYEIWGDAVSANTISMSNNKNNATYYYALGEVTTVGNGKYDANSKPFWLRQKTLSYHYYATFEDSTAAYKVSETSGTYNILDKFIVSIKEAQETQVGAKPGYTFGIENPTGVLANYKWYRNGEIVSTSASFSDAAPEGVSEYYCEIIPIDQSDTKVKSAITKIVEVSNEIATASTDLTSVTGAYVIITPPDQRTVDNCSNMYSFLNNVKDKTNLMTVTNAETNKELLRRHINLSKPKIEFVENAAILGKPKAYDESLNPDDFRLISVNKTGADGVQYNAYQLEYHFKITNSTDATPNETRYYCDLYVDTNADGRYRDSELLTGLKIYEKGGQVPGKKVTSGKLKAETEYYAECELPSDMVGIVPWRLEMTKVGTGTGVSAVDNSHIHTSEHDYAYIKPEAAQVINILQVNTSRVSNSWFGLVTTHYNGINLEEQLEIETNVGKGYISAAGDRYKGIYGKLFADVSDDFEVNITTVKTTDLDNAVNWERTIIDDNSESQTVIYNSLKEYLDSYNMLVLGFDDCYQELSATSADEIVGFIDTGKAVLFTHDTTSFFFLPSRTYQTDRGVWESLVSGVKYMKYVYGKPGLINSAIDFINNKYSSFGYNFNMRLRDAVGLDRYGVTNGTYGINSFTPEIFRAADWNGVVARGNNLDDQQKADLTALDYSIAYEPKSGKANAQTGETTDKKTVPETQGLTNWLMMRYYVKGGKTTKDAKTGSFSDYTTTKVTQVNEGQITTYPYDVNTSKFGGNSDSDNGNGYMNIAPTHFQYQQLNMNSDDVVVWYTLAAKEFDKSPNDVTNSYYIYSCGNVTYSGMGHTTDPSTVNGNVNEAKLFVNTMIASFRIAQSKPAVRFTDVQGARAATSVLIPLDRGTALVTKRTGSIKDNSRAIFFTIKDSNIGNKTINAKFAISKNDETPVDQPGTTLNVYEKHVSGVDLKKPSGLGLVPGVVYYVKLDDIIKAFGPEMDNMPVNLNIQVSCKLKGAIRDKTLLSDIASIKLYKLEMFDLG